jgi:gluconate 2-dehydrogenase gamma chain
VDRRTFIARLALATALPAAFRLRDGDAAALERAAPGVDGPYEAGLTADERRFVDALAEGILPETDTPGARAAKVPEFIAMLFDEWMLVDEQRAFRAGLAALEAECTQLKGRAFADCTPVEQLALLEQWDEAASQAPPGPQAPFFRRFKSLVVTAYYTSEVGQVDELKIQFGAGQDSAAGPVMSAPPFGI